jgi:hypothetical protein
MRRIESGFHYEATPVGQFHAQTAACRRGIDQFHRNQLFGFRNWPANTIPMPVIIQSMQCHTPCCAECLPRQSALLKITHQAFCFSLAPMTPRRLRVVLSHAKSSTRNQISRKGGVARRHTLDLLLLKTTEPAAKGGRPSAFQLSIPRPEGVFSPVESRVERFVDDCSLFQSDGSSQTESISSGSPAISS